MNMTEAERLLYDEKLTCVIFKGDRVYTSKARGVKPLLDFLDSGEDFRGFSSADKVVGNGAAFIYVLLGIGEVSAAVASEAAKKTLEKYGIKCSFEKIVPAIINRTGDGFCPIETCVKGIDDPAEALAAIKSRLAELSGGRG